MNLTCLVFGHVIDLEYYQPLIKNHFKWGGYNLVTCRECPKTAVLGKIGLDINWSWSSLVAFGFA